MEDTPNAVGAHELRAVQKSKSLLCAEVNGWPVVFFINGVGGITGALYGHFSQSDEG